MVLPVITITRQIGSDGDALGRGVADRLGVPLLAQQVLELAAQEAGVSLETLEAAERVPSWRERLFEAMDRTITLESFDIVMAPTTLDRMSTSSDYRHLIEQVVRGLADRSPCVIVGHAAPAVLRERTDVLRVFVHAPEAVRAQRIAVERSLRPAEAHSLVHHDDLERSKFFQTYYGVRWDDPGLYGLCVNTGVLDLEAAVDVVLHAAAHVGAALPEGDRS